MKQTSKHAIGLRYGLTGGILYVVLLLLRYRLFAANPNTFFSAGLVSYLCILIVFLFCGIARKKSLKGQATLQEIFQSIFIAILLTELSYVLFNFIYLKLIDTAFVENFKVSSLLYYKSLNYTPDQIDLEMKGIQTLTDAVKPAGLLKGFGTIVVMDSIFGFIFSAVLNIKKPVSANPKL